MKEIIRILSLLLIAQTAFGQPTDSTEIIVTAIRPAIKPLSSANLHGGETWYALGNFAWIDFVDTNLKYPKRALKKNTHGTVKVKFRLTRKGKIRLVRIAGKRLGNGTTREAKRVVKLSQHGGWWIKEDEKGRARPSRGTTEVKFKSKSESR
jgi:hypothetical protein